MAASTAAETEHGVNNTEGEVTHQGLAKQYVCYCSFLENQDKNKKSKEEVEDHYVLVTDPGDRLKVELPLNEECLALSLLQHYFPGAIGLGFLPPSSHSDVMRCLVIRDGNLLPPSGGWKENIEYKVIKKTVCKPADSIESRAQRIQKAILDVKQLAQSKSARKLHERIKKIVHPQKSPESSRK